MVARHVGSCETLSTVMHTSTDRSLGRNVVQGCLQDNIVNSRARSVAHLLIV